MSSHNRNLLIPVAAAVGIIKAYLHCRAYLTAVNYI